MSCTICHCLDPATRFRRRTKRAGYGLAILCALFWHAGTQVLAQQAALPAGLQIAAKVNGTPIYVSEIAANFHHMIRAQGQNVDRSPRSVAEVLHELIKRQMIVQMLKREGGYVSEEELEQLLSPARQQAQKQNTTLDELAEKQGVTVDVFRDELIWQHGWPRYVERNLTDHLQDYFNAHRRDFDGSQVRASHIVLRPDRDDENALKLIERAKQIRQGIEEGKLTFEQAALRFSAGPSRQQGGDLGFFPRHGVMAEAFSKVAFELEENQLSDPILTPFGVHLIRVTGSKPGNKQWTEVVDQLRQPAAIDMLNTVVLREVEEASIEMTGVVPYLDPHNGQLVVPQQSTP